MEKFSKQDLFSRSYTLYGEEAMERLHTSTIILFGLGGVGGHAAEALVRAGIKKLIIVDGDCIAPSNINRQLFARYNDIARAKTEVAFERLSSISPYTEIVPIHAFYLPQCTVEIPKDVDMVLDCIDNISAKLHIMEICAKENIALISSMGMGNRFDPRQIQISKLEKTSGDPLSRVMRRETKKRGLSNISIVYSTEEAAKHNLSSTRKSVPASLPFVPSVAGIYMAYTACEVLSNKLNMQDFVPKILESGDSDDAKS